jgi:hypothetical protein
VSADVVVHCAVCGAEGVAPADAVYAATWTLHQLRLPSGWMRPRGGSWTCSSCAGSSVADDIRVRLEALGRDLALSDEACCFPSDGEETATWLSEHAVHRAKAEVGRALLAALGVEQ